MFGTEPSCCFTALRSGCEVVGEASMDDGVGMRDTDNSLIVFTGRKVWVKLPAVTIVVIDKTPFRKVK
jgi:hypothetical protein